MESCSICLFISLIRMPFDSIHSIAHRDVFHFNNAPFFVYAMPSCLCICLSVDTWVAPSVEILIIIM